MSFARWEAWCLTAMALVTILRLPAALRFAEQRGFWLAMAAATVSMSFHIGAVAGLVERVVGVSGWVDLYRHACGLASVVLILDLALAIADRHRVRARCLAAVVLLTLLVLTAVIGTHAPNNLVSASESTSWATRLYWWILLSAHLSMNLAYLWLCVRHSSRVASSPVRVALRILGMATLLGSCYMAVSMTYLVLRTAPALAVLPAIGAGQAACLAAATAIPLLHSIRVSTAELMALHQLGPLWRTLVEAVPEVELQTGSTRGWFSIHTRLYRRAIEIRDALLVVSGYVPAERAAAIAAHLTASDVPPGSRDATAAACAVRVGVDRRLRGMVPDHDPGHDFAHSGMTLAEEVRWLRSVARAGRSQPVRAFVDAHVGSRAVTSGR